MTTPDRKPNEDTLKRVQRILATARPDQVRKLLWDIRTSHLTNKDMADALN